MNVSKTLEKKVGANYKSVLSAIGGTVFAVLTFLSTVSPETMPAAASILPESWKKYIAYIAGGATLVLWVYNGVQQKNKNVTGGSVEQDHNYRAIRHHR